MKNYSFDAWDGLKLNGRKIWNSRYNDREELESRCPNWASTPVAGEILKALQGLEAEELERSNQYKAEMALRRSKLTKLAASLDEGAEYIPPNQTLTIYQSQVIPGGGGGTYRDPSGRLRKDAEWASHRLFFVKEEELPEGVSLKSEGHIRSCYGLYGIHWNGSSDQRLTINFVDISDGVDGLKEIRSDAYHFQADTYYCVGKGW